MTTFWLDVLLAVWLVQVVVLLAGFLIDTRRERHGDESKG